MKDLLECWKNAYNIEAMAAHGAEGEELTLLGAVVCSDRLYEVYESSSGKYFTIKKKIQPDGMVFTEEKSIFGHELKQKGKPDIRKEDVYYDIVVIQEQSYEKYSSKK